MVNTFLADIANTILTQYGQFGSSLLVILPSQRSKTYLTRQIQQQSPVPVWAPEMRTISELITEISGLSKADNMLLLIRLHAMFIAQTGRTESLDSFVQWGKMLLNDFDDIDKSLADANLLYRNLEQLKSMEDHFDYLTEDQRRVIEQFWAGFSAGNTSPVKENFVRIWQVLHSIYSQYRQALISEGIGYEGLLYRQAYEQMNKGGAYQLANTGHIMVVGLNALSQSEEKILTILKNRGNTTFYWDYSPFYTDDDQHAAGQFLRKNLQLFPSPLHFNPSLPANKPAIEFVACAGVPAQLAMVNQILHQLSDDELRDTAIILADTSLTPLFLQFVPEKIKELNITMGYPTSVSLTYSLLKTIRNVVQRALRRKGQLYIRNSQLIELLSHPLFAGAISGGELELFFKEVSRFPRGLALSELMANRPALKHLHALMVEENAAASKLADFFSEILEWQTEPGIETDCLNSLYTFFSRLDSLIGQNALRLGTDSVMRLAIDFMQAETLPFEGEPLQGLQVMGPLESRALDFDHCIVIGLNEGIWPPQGQKPSFIPFSLRNVFGLPVTHHHDAISAYVFFRLLNRSTRLSLLYNNVSSDGRMFAEPSRFLLQLKYISDFEVKESNQTLPLTQEPARIIEVEKSRRIMDELAKYTRPDNKNYLSPSALNTYIDCSLRFYYRYIQRIKEPEQVTDTIQPNEFGTILHTAMHKLYSPMVGRPVNPNDLAELLQNSTLIATTVDMAIKQVLNSQKAGTDFVADNTENLLAVAITEYVNQIIRFDKAQAPLTLLELETEYGYRFCLPDIAGAEVAVGGTIDRVHRTGTQHCIVDYKTGKAKTTFSAIDSLFDPENKDRNAAVFQLFTYSLLYRNSTTHTPVAAIYRTADLFDTDYQPFVTARDEHVPFESLLDSFEVAFLKLLQNIFDPSMPFGQTSISDRCSYCPYKLLCAR